MSLSWSPTQREEHIPHYGESRETETACVHCADGLVESHYWGPRKGWTLSRCPDCEEPCCRPCARIIEEDVEHNCKEAINAR